MDFSVKTNQILYHFDFFEGVDNVSNKQFTVIVLDSIAIDWNYCR